MALMLTESGGESLRGGTATTSLQISYGPRQSVPVCGSQVNKDVPPALSWKEPSLPLPEHLSTFSIIAVQDKSWSFQQATLALCPQLNMH